MLAVSSAVDVRSYSVLLETTDDVRYRTHQPDSLTIAIELPNVTGRSAANRFSPVVDGPVQAVSVEERREPNGEFVTVVRLAMRQPVPYRVATTGGVIRIEFARIADDEVLVGTDGELATPAGTLAAFEAANVATLITDIVTRRVPGGVAVTLRGNGRLLAGYIGPVSGSPPRLMLDFPDVTATVPMLITPEAGPIDRIRVALNSRTPLVTRVVIDLAIDVDYEVVPSEANPGDITLLVKDAKDAPRDAADASAASDAPISTAGSGVIAVGEPFRIDPMSALREQERADRDMGDDRPASPVAALPPATAPLEPDTPPRARTLEADEPIPAPVAVVETDPLAASLDPLGASPDVTPVAAAPAPAPVDQSPSPEVVEPIATSPASPAPVASAPGPGPGPGPAPASPAPMVAPLPVEQIADLPELAQTPSTEVLQAVPPPAPIVPPLPANQGVPPVPTVVAQSAPSEPEAPR